MTNQSVTPSRLTLEALKALEDAVGADWVAQDEHTLSNYSTNTLPGGDCRPAAVVYPANTSQVQALVRAANKYDLHLHTISTGENRGFGGRSSGSPGRIIVDLGRRMNRILKVDDELCYAVVEPGVTYEQLVRELHLLGDTLMADVTSGPPTGGVIGNTLDKGNGYTPYSQHVQMSCGYEIVLPDGRVFRTGAGELENDSMWHLSKNNIGPQLEGMFLQSNLGIVTRMGVWLMPKPESIRTFFFEFPDEEDLGRSIDAVRRLRLGGIVNGGMHVSSDLYLLGAVCTYPFDRAKQKTPLPDGLRSELQNEHGVGAWSVSGAIYGSASRVEQTLEQVRRVINPDGKAIEVSEAEARNLPALGHDIDVFNGEPTTQQLGLQDWRPGRGMLWFSPPAPLTGNACMQQQELARTTVRKHGFEYVAKYGCGSRTARALHLILFNREDANEARRATHCYEDLLNRFASEGWVPTRIPLGFHDEASQMFPQHTRLCGQIKQVLDPHEILSPGHFGIRPARQ